MAERYTVTVKVPLELQVGTEDESEIRYGIQEILKLLRKQLAKAADGDVRLKDPQKTVDRILESYVDLKFKEAVGIKVYPLDAAGLAELEEKYEVERKEK